MDESIAKDSPSDALSTELRTNDSDVETDVDDDDDEDDGTETSTVDKNSSVDESRGEKSPRRDV